MAQAPRVMEIITPLGEDVLLFHRMNAREELSRLYEYRIDLLSTKNDVNLDEIMGKNVTVNLELPAGNKRHFNGFVSRFAQGGTFERYYTYSATVRPWLWFLTRRSNCRIFQDMTVPEIIKKVFVDHEAVADVEFELSGDYGKWEYCVQYRESDFNFVSRLMEQEGIYYYFKHQESRHTAVMADSYTAHNMIEGYEEMPFIPVGRSVRPLQEHVSDWRYEREIQPGRFAMDDYNFERPSVELLSKTQVTRKHAMADYEVYDYPGEFEAADDGQNYVRTRLEEIQTQFEVIQAQSNARGVTVGSLFKLTGHTRTDQNREYLITGATYNLEYSDYASLGGGGSHYSCSFTAMNSSQPFRAQCSTRKPMVQGPQTAVVTGPSGDELYTDKHGRVKVQFHWDREGKHDQNTSCWMRVSHPWAGKGWGAISVPRIGQEVIVDFLEGDPDRPIVTGRVYNAEVMPPFGMPGGAVVSGIKSNTHKGSGYNELSMDDTAGKEKITIHGQYDMNTTVEHDQSNTIKNNRSSTVIVDDSLNVNANRTVHVKGKLAEKIDAGQEVTVSAGFKETITGGATSSVTGGLTESISGEHKTTVTGPIDQSASATIKSHATGAGEYSSDASLKLSVAGSVVEITPAAITISSSGSTIKIDAAGVSLNGAKISLN